MSSKQSKKGQEFLCKVRYKNQLPLLPMPPKMLSLQNPNEALEMMQYVQSDYYKKQPIEPLAAMTLGLGIDFVDLQSLTITDNESDHLAQTNGSVNSLPRPQTVDEQDLAILEPFKSRKVVNEEDSLDAKNGGKRPVVSWLRRTEYFSADSTKSMGKSGLGDLKRHLNRQRKSILGMDFSRDGQIKIINDTFDDLQPLEELKHPQDESLHAVEEYVLQPDMAMDSIVLTNCIFDQDPTPPTSLYPNVIQDGPRFLKPLSNPDNPNDQFMIFFCSVPVENINSEDSMDVDSGNQQPDGQLPTDQAVAIRNYNFRVSKEQDQSKMLVRIQKSGRVAKFSSVSARIQLQKRRRQNVDRFGRTGASNMNDIPTDLLINRIESSQSDSKAQAEDQLEEVDAQK
ncbi:hypothetical protein MP228_006096 [Amoeboaphelidium protococcarum]|nr:hypothetical protein MP228_006096 [Amoeboaphelidium protococcarum]